MFFEKITLQFDVTKTLFSDFITSVNMCSQTSQCVQTKVVSNMLIKPNVDQHDALFRGYKHLFLLRQNVII